MSSLGLDIGGANLKFFYDADKKGGVEYFPMWKKAKKLEEKLCEFAKTFSPDKVGVVITAELSDVFASKAEGVKFVEKAVRKAFGNSTIHFLDVEGRLSKKAEPPLAFAASNWIASTLFLARNFESFILADMGSTTTDLIPFKGKILAAKTDYERLRRGELIYIGVLRTPVFHVLPFFTAPLVPEFFAITGDVFVVTGDIKPEDYLCETPDGRGRSVEECMQRLARQLCCDLHEVGAEFVRGLAKETKKYILERISSAMFEISAKYGIKTVIGCGIGEFLLEGVAKKLDLDYVSIKKKYGDCSVYFPAYAMARLLE
ncbi:MAG: H4MPT-linked C1 transfer pathway protein [Archaeoglobales archaeon]|nr:MAG: H4MPT-linked C1 transfer pathway protein [Archaeoglobales archaeon]